MGYLTPGPAISELTMLSSPSQYPCKALNRSTTWSCDPLMSRLVMLSVHDPRL